MWKSRNILRKKYHEILCVLSLIISISVLYWPVTGFEFIDLDDNLYLYENPAIHKGLSWQGISWAMTTFHTSNWQPLTWLSLMADYELYGLNPAGYHVSNLLFHILNTLLLFFFLKQVTGDTWKCFAVSALFAVHPLNIESVAWISERKNLLSTLFWILTLFAYIRYVQKRQWRRYSHVLLFFIIGLMAKPMLVTLPVVLLLIDYWPLRRLSSINQYCGELFPESVNRGSNLLCLLKEKIPLLFLSLCSALITLYAARTWGAIVPISALPLSERVGNALISYMSYLEKTLWPVNLAIFYPYSPIRPLEIIVAILLLVAITVFIVVKRSEYPYLVTGWFWYLVTLLPVIGIIQVGSQAMANRYAYIPLIGLFVIVVWGIPELLKNRIDCRYFPIPVFALILIMSFSTWAQLPYWRNSELVYRQALNATKENHVAHFGMGNVWRNRGDLRKAYSHYREAIKINPNYTEAHNNIGLILTQYGELHEAYFHYLQALRINPKYAEARNNLGLTLIRFGKTDQAESQFRQAIEDNPMLASAYNNLGALLITKGQTAEAKACLLRALELQPTYKEAKDNIDLLQQKEGKVRESR